MSPSGGHTRFGGGLPQPSSAAETTARASACTSARCSGPRRLSAYSLVDVFGARRSGGEPGVLGLYLEAADGRAVARRMRELRRDVFAGQSRRRHGLGSEFRERRLLLGRGGSIDALIGGCAEGGLQLAVPLRRRLAGDGDDLGGQQAQQDAVLVGRPDGAVATEEDAPADSSPPNATEPSSRPGTNHLNPTGTSNNRRPSDSATRSMIIEDTSVLPIAASRGQSCRCEKR